MRSRLLPAVLVGLSALIFTACSALRRLRRWRSDHVDEERYRQLWRRRVHALHGACTSHAPVAENGLRSVFDRHSEDLILSTARAGVPAAASLLLYPVRGSFSPTCSAAQDGHDEIDSLSDEDADTLSTRRFGCTRVWRRGGRRPSRRHPCRLRYTFLTSATTMTTALLGRVAPRHEGSMWTAGFTIYF